MSSERYVIGKEALEALLEPCSCGHDFKLDSDELCLKRENDRSIVRVCPECGECWVLDPVAESN